MLFKRFALITKKSFLFVILVLLTGMSSAADWPHWRGPNRNDLTPETSGLKEKAWTTKRLWNKRVGYGSTSPIVYKNRLYTAGWVNNRDYIYCLNAATGKVIWKKSYNCLPYGRFARGDQSSCKGVTSTPEYDSQTNLLYTLSTDGNLRCWNADNGRDIWHFNLYDKYKVPRRPGNRDYGYTSSPLALDKWLIVEVGDNEGCLMAFNKHTGKRIWVSQAKDTAEHNGGPTPSMILNDVFRKKRFISPSDLYLVDGFSIGSSNIKYEEPLQNQKKGCKQMLTALIFETYFCHGLTTRL